MTDWITLVGALGLGSLATVIPQWFLARAVDRRSLRFEERKEAYVGLLQAMHRSEIEKSDDAALRVGHWCARCELVAPLAVRNAVRHLVNTMPGTKERKNAA